MKSSSLKVKTLLLIFFFKILHGLIVSSSARSALLRNQKNILGNYINKDRESKILRAYSFLIAN